MLVKRGGGRGRGWRARRGKDQVALFVKGFKYLSVGHWNGSLLAFFWVGLGVGGLEVMSRVCFWGRFRLGG